MTTLFCYSVGAVIKNPKGEYLMLYRLVKPHGLAMPAGHIDPGEEPGVAVRREVLEETGIRIINIVRRWEQIVPVECSRGATVHFWYVFDVKSYQGEPELREPHKHKFLRFMSLEEIRQYADRKDFDPSWSNFIFKDLSIL